MAAGETSLNRLEIRPLRGLREFEATLALQQRIWGFSEADSVAPRLFGVFERTGGACLGAFLDGALVGYTLAFAAFKPDRRPYWHSHMAGVEPAAQNQGIGRLLKLRQREEALAAGLDLIEWTFDPLQARNAYFNIAKLGTAVEGYLPDFYGITSSELHGSLPTDRLVAAWHLRATAVTARLAGKRPAVPGGRATIEIPARISEVPRDEARSIQLRVRAQFREAFAANLRVTGFELAARGGVYRLDG